MRISKNTIWHTISEDRIKPEDFLAYIEIPKGCKNKYELDKESGALILDRILYTSTHYPANYGFIPKTLGDDGDPLDVLVICTEDIISGALVRVKPIGVVRMIDQGLGDEKIVAVPFNDPNYNVYNDISELPKHIIDEIEHFFSVYKTLENKETVINNRGGKDDAIEYVKKAIELYKGKFKDLNDYWDF